MTRQVRDRRRERREGRNETRPTSSSLLCPSFLLSRAQSRELVQPSSSLKARKSLTSLPLTAIPLFPAQLPPLLSLPLSPPSPPSLLLPFHSQYLSLSPPPKYLPSSPPPCVDGGGAEFVDITVEATLLVEFFFLSFEPFLSCWPNESD